MKPQDRFIACRELALHGPPHTPASMTEYKTMIAREYRRADDRRSPHQQQPLPWVV